jgi:hypothetical protein
VIYSKYKDMEIIELILKESSAWGLEHEVKTLAEKLMTEDSTLKAKDAYAQSYNEWIK